MPKANRSRKVSIQNIWGVEETSKAYKVRFRCDQSTDGWASAFIPKNGRVEVEASTKYKMFDLTAQDENIPVRVRLKNGDHHHEVEVPLRAPLGSDAPGFKELYEKSRALVKSDKAAKGAPAREVPVVEDQWEDFATGLADVFGDEPEPF